MKRFDNQVAIISGGADGLGKGIAERLASEGASVALFDINEKVLSQTVSEFKKKGLAVESYGVDIYSESAVQKAMQEVENKVGGIDILVKYPGLVSPNKHKVKGYTVKEY